MATCSPGLEGLLADELRELGVEGIHEASSAVRFKGSWPDVWRANYWLRTANRVLVELGSCAAGDNEALYQGIRAILLPHRIACLPTRTLLDPARTLAVSATSHRSRLRDTRWVALKVKDAVVDLQRERFGRRASVDTRRPDLPLRVRLHADRATLLLDSSREPLDRRGYRTRSGVAPLRENLAAACVLASGWNGRGPVVDPMCGTGTLLVEAAWWAQGRAPGCLRREWVFSRWPGFEPRMFAKARSAPPGPRRSDGPTRLWGIDRSADAIRSARQNLARAGLASQSVLREGDGHAFSPPAGPGLVATNPAHGERLQLADDQWRLLGDLLKRRYGGWRAVVLAGGESRGKPIGLRPELRLPVRNGPLDARILVFALYEGSLAARAER